MDNNEILDFFPNLSAQHDQLESILKLVKQIQNQRSAGLDTLKIEKELTKLLKTLGYTEKNIRSFFTSVKEGSTVLQKYKSLLSEMEAVTATNSETAKSFNSAIKSQLLGFKSLSSSVKDAIANAEKQNDVSEFHKAVMLKELREMERVINAEKRLTIQRKEEALFTAKLTRETENFTDSLKRGNKIVSGFGSDFSKLTGFFGAQTFTIGNAVKSVKSYNQSAFDLSRTYKIIGGGTKDMSSVFQSVAKNTTFSKQQFVDFANSFASGYNGISPTVDKIAEFTELLNTQFGPNVEKAQAAGKSLLEVFSKYPPALEQMMRVQEVMKKAQMGGEAGKAGQNELKDMQQNMLAVAMATGASQQQLDDILKATTLVSEEEKKRLALNKEQAKTEQKSADQVLAMGQALEKTMIDFNRGINSVLDMMQLLPNGAYLMLGAFQSVGAVMKSNLIGNMDILPKKANLFIDRLGQSKNNAKLLADELERAARAIDTASRSEAERAARTASTAQRVAGASSVTIAPPGAIPPIRNAREVETADRAGKTFISHVTRAGKDFAGATARAGKGAVGMAMGAGGRVSAGMVSALPMAIMGGIMAKGLMESQSVEQGFSEKEAKRRGNVVGISSATGTVIGTAIGSAILPGVGSVLGGMLGGMAGQWAGEGILGKDKGKKKDKDKKDGEDLKNVNGLKKEDDVLGAMIRKYRAITTTHEMNAQLLEKQKNALIAQVETLDSLFVLSAKQAEQGYAMAFDSVVNQFQEANDFIQKIATNNPFEDLFAKLGVKFDPNDINSMIKSFQDAIKKELEEQSGLELQLKLLEKQVGKEKEIEDIKGKIANKQSTIISLQDNSNKLSESKAVSDRFALDIANAHGKALRGHLDQQININNSIEARLNAERDVMEAANFGMGASINMMQEQVDLAYKNIEAYQQSAKEQDGITQRGVEQLNSVKRLNDEQKQNVGLIVAEQSAKAKSAKSSAEMERITEETQQRLGDIVTNEEDRKAIGAIINKGAEVYRDVQTKSLQQQKKIYDLTKDIREGYLDAIREMSFGAGEFSKIIGTQEVGVTQLMGAVKGVTGENTLNTMALGGITNVNSAGGKARMGEFARYTDQGLQFGQIGKSTQEAMNQDIHGYAEAQARVASQTRGEGSAKPTAGVIDTNPEHQKGLEAIRDAQLQSDQTRASDVEAGVLGALQKSNGTMVRGVREGAKGFPGRENRGMGQAQGVINWSGGLAGSSTGQVPADANRQHHQAPGPMPNPAGDQGSVGAKGAAGSAGSSSSSGGDLGASGVIDRVRNAYIQDNQKKINSLLGRISETDDADLKNQLRSQIGNLVDQGSIIDSTYAKSISSSIGGNTASQIAGGSDIQTEMAKMRLGAGNVNKSAAFSSLALGLSGDKLKETLNAASPEERKLMATALSGKMEDLPGKIQKFTESMYGTVSGVNLKGTTSRGLRHDATYQQEVAGLSDIIGEDYGGRDKTIEMLKAAGHSDETSDLLERGISLEMKKRGVVPGRKSKTKPESRPALDMQKIIDDAVIKASNIITTSGIPISKKDKEAQSFMSGLANSVQVQEGESASDAFVRTAMSGAVSGGNQLWNGSSKDVKAYIDKTRRAAKLFAKGVNSGQPIGQQYEANALVNSNEENRQINAFNPNVAKNRDIQPMQGNGVNGEGQQTVVTIKLGDGLQADVDKISNLRVELERGFK